MTRKWFAAGLLLVVCLGLMAVRVSSQNPPPLPDVPGTENRTPAQHDTNLEQLVRQLLEVRSQKTELDRREKELVERITKKIQEQRQQLERIEGLLYRDGRGRDKQKTEWKTAEPVRAKKELIREDKSESFSPKKTTIERK